MKSDLAFPMYELPATLRMVDGQRLEVAAFLAEGRPVVEWLEEPRRFLPITIAGRFRLIGRAQIVAVSVSVFCLPSEKELALVRRPMVARLVTGETLRGAVSVPRVAARARMTDHLNQACDSFIIRDGDVAHLVRKDHVVWAEEAS